MADQEPVVIIGGGVGGLSTAIRLAAQGQFVVVFEKNPSTGGKISEYRQDGFRWDIGLSTITMRDVYDDLFRAAGKRLEDYLQLIPVDPIVNCLFSDGKQLDIRRDLPRTLDSISALGEALAEEYLSILAYSARQFRIANPIYPYGSHPTLSSLRKIGFKDLLKADVFRDLKTAINDHSSSKHLQQLFGHYATQVGANPLVAPAILSLMIHIEMSKGVWYPRGGVFSLVQALERLAVEKGVIIRKKSTVRQIVVKEREVRGVILDDGTAIEAAIVVSSVDYGTTYAELLPQNPPYSWELDNYKKRSLSPSAFILLLGVKGRHSNLAQRNIFFSEDYLVEYNQVFREKIPPQDPTLHVTISNKSDMVHAPVGHENWYVKVNVPAIDGKFEWINQTDAYKQIILQKIARFGIDLSEKIVSEKIFTPVDLEQMTGAFHGSLNGITYESWNSFFNRLQPKAKSPEGLYFVGSTIYPGGKAHMAMLSARQVSNLITERQPT